MTNATTSLTSVLSSLLSVFLVLGFSLASLEISKNKCNLKDRLARVERGALEKLPLLVDARKLEFLSVYIRALHPRS